MLGIACAIRCIPAYAAGGGSPADTALANIVALASQRLSQSIPVARYKWVHKLPIYDAAREGSLKHDMTAAAGQYGADPVFAAQFFADQTEASRQLQDSLFTSWRREGGPKEVPDDALMQARGQISRVSQAMLPALARLQGVRSLPDCQSRLRQALNDWQTRMVKLDPPQSAALEHALSHVCQGGGPSSSA